MKKHKRKLFIKTLLVCGAILSALFLSFLIIFVKVTYNTNLDKAKLETIKTASNVNIFDNKMNRIDTSYVFDSKVYVNIDELPEYIKKAFIVTEDKRFYKHNGVDYYRMFGAFINNIKEGSFSQGASTISQQLIKNTHLSRDKTINRKMKEIKLAYILENWYSKNEILEMYLNNIYFGNGCYGLEKASKYYFNKQAKDLTAGEVAMLVGVINAPSIYDPVARNENAEKRKKLVLKLMKEQGVISDDEYEKNAKNKEKVVKKCNLNPNSYLKTVLYEASKKLNISLNQLKNMNVNIETYIDSEIQDNVLICVNNQNLFKTASLNYGAIIIDNKTKGIVSLLSSGGVNVLEDKHQPGSTIKPLLVYGPALEYGLIYPETIICDEEINISGYSPSNANKKFLGNVSVRESIEKSLNIPAVKVLSRVGVERAKSFAKKIGLTFNPKDKNLALALGGMTDGLSLRQIADAYSTFATDGFYKKSNVIKKITDEKGAVLFEDKDVSLQVFSEATADLMTDLLKGVVDNGTARRMSSLPFDVASKTGTVGLVSIKENTDAYNVSYTSAHTIILWIGAVGDDYLNSDVNGSTYPTILVKNIMEKIYQKQKPGEFVYGDDVIFKAVDTRSLSNGFVELAGDDVAVANKKLALFNRKYLPDNSKHAEILMSNLEVSMEENMKPTFIFQTNNEHKYSLIRKDIFLNNEVEVCNVAGNGKVQKYIDNSAKNGVIYEYYLKIMHKKLDDIKKSNNIKLMSY